MLWIALLSRPLAIITRQLNAIPRFLADDWTAHVHGRAVPPKCCAVVCMCVVYLDALGATMSLRKSACFATNAATSAKLRAMQWPLIDAQLPVLLSARDLGRI